MRWLHSKGLQPTNLADRRQDIITPVVISEINLAAYLLGEAQRNVVEILADVDAVNAVDVHLAYFEAIGADDDGITNFGPYPISRCSAALTSHNTTTRHHKWLIGHGSGPEVSPDEASRTAMSSTPSTSCLISRCLVALGTDARVGHPPPARRAGNDG